MKMKEQNTKNLIIVGLVVALCIISFFLGTKQDEPQKGYEYIKSEKLDSLENASRDNIYTIDSMKSELEVMRSEIDSSVFLSDVEVEKIVKESYDELYNQTPSHIDSLFISEYDSAVAARRLLYNGQR